jgi:hypothetical protein
MKIYGAGISGLLAGTIFQTADIFEAAPPKTEQHKALLRFRTSSVGDAVGIDFRKVTVHKGLWHEGRFVAPDIRMANWYSLKVIGRLASRSVWNLDQADRYVAPEDFVSLLIERCNRRIHWNHKLTREEVLEEKGPVVSTLPMDVMVGFMANELESSFIQSAPCFTHQPIKVTRWAVPNADVFQTVYYPSPDTSLYRASMTGDTLIAEFVDDGTLVPCLDELFESFGIRQNDVHKIETSKQRYGKIVSVDEAWRKQFIFWLTHYQNIFSLGRYGTWRNILLDDVIHDVTVLKKIINSSSYERMKINYK